MLLKQRYIDKCILKGLIQHQIQKVVHALSHWREGYFEYRDCSVEFDDREALSAFSVHPEYVPVLDLIHEISSEYAVVDMEIESN